MFCLFCRVFSPLQDRSNNNFHKKNLKKESILNFLLNKTSRPLQKIKFFLKFEQQKHIKTTLIFNTILFSIK